VPFRAQIRKSLNKTAGEGIFEVKRTQARWCVQFKSARPMANPRSQSVINRLAIFFLFFAVPVFGQSNAGELHLKVIDPSGAAVRTTVQIVSEANQYRSSLATDEAGSLTVQRLPYGVYQLQIKQPGFAEASESIEIRSSLPTEHTIQLKVTPVSESVTVSSANTLINPEQAGYVSQIGSSTIEDRPTSLPGRSLQDLVNTQPGWFYEGNAVLHPREAEYQTQFIVDGIPLTDNRSPGFGPVIEADDIQSLTAYTAGFPAEYGRKMGGVVEVNTLQTPQLGFHGEAVLSGGSYDSAGSFLQGQYSWGKNTLGATGSVGTTEHYLNPVVAQNFNNTGNIGDFSVNYERSLTPNDRLTLIVRHEYSRYDIPNELVQQQAGQDQTADNFETMGIVSYQHLFSPNAVADFHGMVRDNSNDFYSNAASTPIIISQHNRFREGYFRGALTVNHGRHEWKVGVESDNMFLHENFGWVITDYNLGGFDPSTPPTFTFLGTHPDLEQSAFVQDLIHLGNWTVSAGLRWDHYQLLANQNAVSPRFAISRYLPSAGLILHFSYDRIFQTPSFENILLSSSTAAANLNSSSIQLPVQPSEGNFFEAGATKQFSNRVALSANYFRRSVNNYADDNPFQDTPISFPIAFAKAIIYGVEGKLDLPEWKRFSGFVSYSYQLGNAFNPVTGGLFLGVTSLPTTGHFPASQDQRNTVRSRLQYQIVPRLWVAGEVQFDSGLPFQFNCDPSLTLDQCIQGQIQLYGQQVVNRVNFALGRIYPTVLVGASAGADVYKSDRFKGVFRLTRKTLPMCWI
jgi:Carboxypeptidase regulatory-like domain